MFFAIDAKIFCWNCKKMNNIFLVNSMKFPLTQRKLLLCQPNFNKIFFWVWVIAVKMIALEILDGNIRYWDITLC